MDKIGILGIDLNNHDEPPPGETSEYYHFFVTRKGEWQNETDYVVNDMVYKSGGSTYICILAHTSDEEELEEPFNEPDEGSDWETYWQLLIADVQIDSPPMVQKLWHYGKVMAFCIGNAGGVAGNDVWVMVK